MRHRLTALVGGGVLLAAVALAAWAGGWFRRPAPPPAAFPRPDPAVSESPGPLPGGLRKATFASGCFWCTEAVFQQLRGVQSVVSGYSGGDVENPTYLQVCEGNTGHAEAVQVTYDPRVISYPELLEVFWRTHDPTTPDRQGPDMGSQYRSVIFYHDDEQRRLAEEYRAKLEAAHVFDAPVVTQIVPFQAFYPAEAYHQNFFNDHPRQPYCQAVIGPKVEKLRKLFKDRLKDRESAAETGR
jgi:peptide-methionine (S)-S-oxide reductase